MYIINKKMKQLIIEISSLTMVIVLTFILWNSFEEDDIRRVAYAYTYNENNLKLTSSERTENDNNSIFAKVENNYEEEKEYNIYLKVNNISKEIVKNSTITINSKLIYIKDLEVNEQGTNTYFKIITDLVNGKNINSYYITLNSKIEYDIELKQL